MVASTFITSTSTRGRKAMESSAQRLRLSVVSDSAPPVSASHTMGDSRRFASMTISWSVDISLILGTAISPFL